MHVSSTVCVLFEKSLLFLSFLGFSGGFLRPTCLRFANKLMPNGSRPNVFHDTASLRLVSHVASRLRCVASSWVEGGPTRNQLTAAAQPTNCKTNSDRATTLAATATEAATATATATDKAKRAFLFWTSREQGACQANLCALWIDYKLFNKAIRLVLCSWALKTKQLIKCARTLERECCI